MRLRTQVLLLQLVVIAVSLGVGFGVVIVAADDRVRDEYAQRALAIAESVAADADVRSAVAGEQGTDVDAAVLAVGPLQQQANAVRSRTGALFVVIANRDGIRLAHPEAAEVGRHVSTDPMRALSGQVDLTTDRGTLGDSVRAKVPVLDDRGRVIGLVSVGVSTQRSDADTRGTILALLAIALAALAIGGIGSWLLARRWQRLTLGLQPDELAELVREQGAVLHAMADGVLAVDAGGVVRVANDRARELLGLTAPVGAQVNDLRLSPRIVAVLDDPTDDPVAATVGDRVVLVSSHRVSADGRDLGMVLSMIDRTDVERLTREVDSIRSMSSALRAQRHETANRMHVLAGLLRHGHADDALAYLDEITGGTGGRAHLEGLENVQEPHLHAFLDAKAAYARERGVTLRIGPQTWVLGTLTEPVVTTTVLGNLMDNGIDAAADENAAATKEVEVELVMDDDRLLITVGDSGPGISAEEPQSVFDEGITSKPSAGTPGGRAWVLRSPASSLDASAATSGSSTPGAANPWAAQSLWQRCPAYSTLRTARMNEHPWATPDRRHHDHHRIMTTTELGVLIVDDDFRVAALHASIVTSLHGFRVVATAGSVEQTRIAVRTHPDIDLALLDVYLPDGSGIDLVDEIPCDCFIVGAETDAAAVRAATRAGALAYLIKPFDDRELARRLAGYAQYRRVLAADHVDQHAVDAALSALRFGTRASERGDSAGSPTEQRILDLFVGDAVLQAEQVSDAVGIAAPTARRHLANLVASGRLTMSLRYGSTGRPRQEYRRSAAQ